MTGKEHEQYERYTSGFDIPQTHMTDLSQISEVPISTMTDKEHEKYDRYTKKFHIPQYDIP